MGKIIARIRRRQQGVLNRLWSDLKLWELEQQAKAADRFLTSEGAPPGMLKFRRPVAWGTSTTELRQPEEQAKNEAMRQRVDELPMRKQP